MVKFGKHQQVFLDNLGVSELYTVPYDEFKHRYIPPKHAEEGKQINEKLKDLTLAEFEERFVAHWTECLEKVVADFNSCVQKFWDSVFLGIDHLPGSRGAVPDQALRLYLSTLSEDKVSEIHLQLKQLHGAALLNSEALRKIAKKFDKQHVPADPSGPTTSARLLPRIYSSSFCLGLPTLESGLLLIRNFLGFDGEDADEEEARHLEATRRRLRNLSVDWSNVNFNGDDSEMLEGGFLPLKKKDSDAVLIDKRNSELQWLRQFVQDFPPDLIGKLVGHRGFHSVQDKSDRRPIENSLIAYEACWTNGIHLCECDIALTKDERIILCHDETFTRLALDPTDEKCQRKVRDLTYREIISLPLKSGNRPPLLFDVLRSADVIGDNARMVVEIKPGNVESGTALARMFARHPDLMSRCAVVMSFDAFAMHQFRKELTHVMDHLVLEHKQGLLESISARTNYPQLPPPIPNHRRVSSQTFSIPTAMSIGQSLEDMASEVVALSPNVPAHRRIDSTDHFGVGVSLRPSTDYLQNSAQFRFNVANADDGDGSGFGQFQILSERSPSVTAPAAGFPLETIPAGEPAAIKPIDSQVQSAVESMLYRPELLLITGKISDNPQVECELQVSVNDVSPIDNWLHGGAAGSLDGVYMQFESEMLTDDGSRKMRELASKYDVGIWGANPKPDDFATFEHLVRECGVSYVNSSLPRKFMGK